MDSKKQETGFIYVNNRGKTFIKALDSDVGIEQTLEQLFIQPYIQQS